MLQLLEANGSIIFDLQICKSGNLANADRYNGLVFQSTESWALSSFCVNFCGNPRQPRCIIIKSDGLPPSVSILCSWTTELSIPVVKKKKESVVSKWFTVTWHTDSFPNNGSCASHGTICPSLIITVVSDGLKGRMWSGKWQGSVTQLYIMSK